jgi:hypothetical protein
VWRYLDDDERDVLTERMDLLLRTREWEAAQGFELTDRIRVVIAAQASLLILGLDDEVYDGVGSIIVHPTTMRVNRTTAGPAEGTVACGSVALLGETVYDGPVVLAWDSASFAARHPERGSDVVLHEFAHKLDMLDGVVDGTPPLLGDQATLDRWVEVCTDLYERVVEDGDDVIDDYAATNAGEFFAVATEAFFTRSDALRDLHPDLYDLLVTVYRQDPAERWSRPERPASDTTTGP